MGGSVLEEMSTGVSLLACFEDGYRMTGPKKLLALLKN